MAGEKYKPKQSPKPVNFLSAETVAKLNALASRPEVRLDEKHFDFVDRGGVRYYSPKVANVRGADTKRSGRCRYGVWIDIARQKLMVDPGTIIYGATTGLNTPLFPKLGGKQLDEVDANGWGQGFDISGKSIGVVYTVVLFYRVGECGSFIPLDDEGDDVDEDINTVQLKSPGELEGIEWTADENNEGGKGAIVVAEVRFKEGELGLEIDSLRQFLGSDLRPGCYQPDDSGDGDGSGDGSDSEDLSGGSGSDEDPDPDPDPGSGSESDEESDEMSEPCCPGIPDLDGIVISVAGDPCFDLYEARTVEVSVHGYVGLIPQTTDCKKCNWRFRVEFGIGSNNAAEQIGYGGHNFQHTFNISAWPCQEWEIWAQIRRFGVPTSSNGCEDLTHCRVVKKLRMPPVCGWDCEDEESGTTIMPTIIPPP